MKLLQTLVLIAGLLWSGVCVAQCRVLPVGLKKSTTAKKLPPCHQKQQQEKKDCQDESCATPYADAEKSFDDFVVALPSTAVEIVRAVSVSVADHHAARLPMNDRPPGANSILRI